MAQSLDAVGVEPQAWLRRKISWTRFALSQNHEVSISSL